MFNTVINSYHQKATQKLPKFSIKGNKNRNSLCRKHVDTLTFGKHNYGSKKIERKSERMGVISSFQEKDERKHLLKKVGSN